MSPVWLLWYWDKQGNAPSIQPTMGSCYLILSLYLNACALFRYAPQSRVCFTHAIAAAHSGCWADIKETQENQWAYHLAELSDRKSSFFRWESGCAASSSLLTMKTV